VGCCVGVLFVCWVGGGGSGWSLLGFFFFFFFFFFFRYISVKFYSAAWTAREIVACNTLYQSQNNCGVRIGLLNIFVFVFSIHSTSKLQNHCDRLGYLNNVKSRKYIIE